MAKRYNEQYAKDFFELCKANRLIDISNKYNIPISTIRRVLRRYNYPSIKMIRAYAGYAELTEAELGYIAGIIDGEGYIHKNGMILITTTSLELAEWLAFKCGGKYKARVLLPHRKQSYSWRLSCLRGRRLLRLISTYLIIKKPCLDILEPYPI
jgi:transposase